MVLEWLYIANMNNTSYSKRVQVFPQYPENPGLTVALA
jgi:hypothetical protein